MAYNSSSSSSSNSEASTYKRGLATVEAQLVTFRKNEVLFSEEIAVLKREVGCKNYEIGVSMPVSVLKTEFEKLLESQITDKSKKGIGYHVVAPPHPLSLNAPTKLDLSYSGLKEFQQPEFEGYKVKYEHVSSKVTRSQEGKRLQDDEKR
ncbi:hypothetical protein Tco_0238628 [Tanacetum coccineum]